MSDELPQNQQAPDEQVSSESQPNEPVQSQPEALPEKSAEGEQASDEQPASTLAAQEADNGSLPALPEGFFYEKIEIARKEVFVKAEIAVNQTNGVSFKKLYLPDGTTMAKPLE